MTTLAEEADAVMGEIVRCQAAWLGITDDRLVAFAGQFWEQHVRCVVGTMDTPLNVDDARAALRLVLEDARKAEPLTTMSWIRMAAGHAAISSVEGLPEEDAWRHLGIARYRLGYVEAIAFAILQPGVLTKMKNSRDAAMAKAAAEQRNLAIKEWCDVHLQSAQRRPTKSELTTRVLEAKSDAEKPLTDLKKSRVMALLGGWWPKWLDDNLVEPIKATRSGITPRHARSSRH